MAHYLNGGSLTLETSLQAISGQVTHHGHNVLYVAHLKNTVNTDSSHMNLPSSSLIPLVAFLSHFSASSLRSLTLWLMSFRPPDTPPRDSIFICSSRYCFSVLLRLWQMMQSFYSTFYIYIYIFISSIILVQTPPTASPAPVKMLGQWHYRPVL